MAKKYQLFRHWRNLVMPYENNEEHQAKRGKPGGIV